MKEKLRNFVIAILLLLFSLMLGLFGFMHIEGYSALDAFYMSVITISTVGFGEVRQLSEGGRIFTSFYIILNLGIFAYVVSVITTYIFEGELQSVLRNFMSDRELNKLNNHVIVCGYGRNGSEACEELAQAGKAFVVIDKDPDARPDPSSKPNFQMLIADATLDHNLHLVGIEKASEILITIPSDAANVFITLTARELNPQIKIIARASEKETERKLYRAGADTVVMPHHLGGMFMAQMVTKPAVIEFLDLLTGSSKTGEKFTLEPIKCKELKPQYRNKTLREMQIPNHTGATVIAVKDHDTGLIPSPTADTLIGDGDTMVVLCSEAGLPQFLRLYTDRKAEKKR